MKKNNKVKPVLLCLLPLSALLLSVVVLADTGGAYEGYTTDPLTQPYFTKMMFAIRDGVNPVEELAGNFGISMGDREGERAEVLFAKEDALVRSEEAAASNAGDEEDKSEAGEQATETDETAEAEEITDLTDPTPQVLDLNIPADSTCPVCPAKDYGLANPLYTAPEGWEAVADTSGTFAPNGYYRSLGTVDESYFADALYIGDSRVDGLCDYGGLENEATFAFKNSLTVYRLFEERMKYRNPQGIRGEASLVDILHFASFGKVYLQIGINELGVGNTRQFYEAYRNAILTIRRYQPTAIIYIDGIMHVTGARSSSDSVFTNSLVVERNRAISTLANGRDIFYLDFNPQVCDENGNLLSELSIDHAHLKASPHKRWSEFLLTHAADPNTPAAALYCTDR
ncbi:MAG: hypothetical protein K5739_03990 [Lachnospiraceae bacterium]|nr:hypothetical protein [Lachnospiraceae bacterium]